MRLHGSAVIGFLFLGIVISLLFYIFLPKKLFLPDKLPQISLPLPPRPYQRFGYQEPRATPPPIPPEIKAPPSSPAVAESDSAEAGPPAFTPPPAPPREPQEFIVQIYNNEEVRPANLTIYVGDTITFINEDGELHWPGADPHPTHSSLPTFDALGGISKSQSYSHTFHKVGAFGYHEHLIDNPPTLGIITVLP